MTELSATKPANPNLAPERLVLLVEDDELNGDMLRRRLHRKGFRVELATNGQQGLQQAEALRPAVMLLDMSLPVLDGWEVTRRIKADPALSSIAVIGLSAHAMAGDRERALHAGCDEYETKPVELERLVEKIHRFFAAAGTDTPLE